MLDCVENKLVPIGLALLLLFVVAGENDMINWYKEISQISQYIETSEANAQMQSAMQSKF